jgi:hypothetical protein
MACMPQYHNYIATCGMPASPLQPSHLPNSTEQPLGPSRHHSCCCGRRRRTWGRLAPCAQSAIVLRIHVHIPIQRQNTQLAHICTLCVDL